MLYSSQYITEHKSAIEIESMKNLAFKIDGFLTSRVLQFNFVGKYWGGFFIESNIRYYRNE